MSMFSMAESSAKVLPKKSRVLIVEDHAPTRLAMSKLLRDAGSSAPLGIMDRDAGEYCIVVVGGKNEDEIRGKLGGGFDG